MSAVKSIKICFLAPGVYPMLTSSCPVQWAGGAELQQLQIGRALARAQAEVSYVVNDLGQPERETVDGLTLHRSYRPDQGVLGVRFFYPRLYHIWQALRRADADVYYCRAASFCPAVLACFCRRYRKKFVFGAAHDTDFLPGQHLLPTLRDQALYRFGLRQADAIVVQSRYQQHLLKIYFGLEGRVIRNFLDAPDDTAAGPAPPSVFGKTGEIILWVATIRSWKRPLQFVQLARRLPAHKFVMIGGADNSEPGLFQKVTEECRKLPNIHFLGFQRWEETERYFTQSALFVNTSESEGFPNTFLQAWRRGVPVVSYVDPDGIITENGLGEVVKSEEELYSAVVSAMAGKRPIAGTLQGYFCKNHQLGVIEEYHALFKELSHGA